jgi:hypothetical protein
MAEDLVKAICPYDFINQFDDWFYFWQCVHYHKLTAKQSQLNVEFRRSGWKLADGFVYGMWTLPSRGY